MPAAPGGGAGAPGGHQPPFRVLARDPPAARGTPAAHRPTPRRGRRNGNLRWELCGAPRSRRPGRVRGQLHEDEAPGSPGGTPKSAESVGRGDRGPGCSREWGRGACSPQSPCGSGLCSSRGVPGCDVRDVLCPKNLFQGAGRGGASRRRPRFLSPSWDPRRKEWGGGWKGASITRSFTLSSGTEWRLAPLGLTESFINSTSLLLRAYCVLGARDSETALFPRRLQHPV